MGRPVIAPPVHAANPDAFWPEVREHLERTGAAVVYTTWGEWLPTVLGIRGLRGLLGGDWVRYRNTADPTVRYRLAVSRLLIKYAAAGALGTSPAQIDLAYQLGGRPYLRGFDQIELSLTHTGDFIAVALSRIGRIGVDAEPVGRRLRLELLTSQMCTAAELAELEALSGQRRQAEALRLWTLKEAYTKAIGQGMRLSFTDFGFALRSPRLLAADGSRGDRGEWAFATHRVLDRYLLTTARQDVGLGPVPETEVRTMLDEAFVAAMTQPAERGNR